jgi:hypothetical protein
MTSRNGGKRDRQNQFFRATAMSPIGTNAKFGFERIAAVGHIRF